MAASINSCEAIWLRKLLVNLFRRRMEVTRIMCGNQSCIKLSENLVFYDQSKHIDIRCRFVRDCVQRGDVQLSYTPTGEHVVDILTKALGRTKFAYFREKMGMIKNPFQYQKWVWCCSVDAVLGGRTSSSTNAVLGGRNNNSTNVEGAVVQM